MPDLKISQLTSAATPLAGTEVLPVVQSGSTVKVAVSDLTAGRAVSASALTASSGNLAFSGAAQRITGDMSNATIANRLAFQTSTVNGATTITALPNGTNTNSAFVGYNNSDPANAATAGFAAVGSTDARFFSGISGTGTYLPMTFYTGGSERVRVDTSGNVLIGTTTPSGTSRLYIDSTEARIQSRNSTSGANGYVGAVNPNEWRVWTTVATDLTLGTNNIERMRIDSSGNVGIGTTSPSKKLDVFNSGTTTTDLIVRNGTVSLLSFVDAGAGYTGTSTNHPLLITTNNAERMRIDSSGNVGIGTASPAAKLNVSAASGYLEARVTSGSNNVYVGADGTSAYVGTYQAIPLQFGTNSAERMRITATGNIVAGASAALATNATDGFLYVPTCAGTPTGTPTAITGMAPIVVDTTNNKLYFYSGGTWRDAGP